jgi:hypothetical protein
MLYLDWRLLAPVSQADRRVVKLSKGSRGPVDTVMPSATLTRADLVQVPRRLLLCLVNRFWYVDRNKLAGDWVQDRHGMPPVMSLYADPKLCLYLDRLRCRIQFWRSLRGTSYRSGRRHIAGMCRISVWSLLPSGCIARSASHEPEHPIGTQTDTLSVFGGAVRGSARGLRLPRGRAGFFRLDGRCLNWPHGRYSGPFHTTARAMDRRATLRPQPCTVMRWQVLYPGFGLERL